MFTHTKISALITLSIASSTLAVQAQTLPQRPVPSAAQGAAAQTTPARLQGLLLVSQDPAKPASASTLDAQARELCREPAATRIARPVATPAADVAALRTQLRQLPAQAPASERITSALPEQLLAQDVARERLAGFIGRPIDSALTQAVVGELVSALQQNARYLADVYVPEQTAADGLLVVVVRPALLGQITAQGQKYHKAEDLTCRVRLQAGEPVDLKVLADDLAQLNSSSNWRYTAAPEFTPGAVPGTTDLLLKTTDEQPLRFFFGADNTGSPLTGMGRYRAGVNIGNFLGHFDHQLDYTFTTAAKYKSLNQHSLAYQMPLEERQRLTARLDVTQSDLLLQGDLFRSQGNNQIASVEWTRPQLSPLPDVLQWGTDKSGTTSETSLGLEYKRIGNSLAFNQVVVSDRAPQVLQGYGAWRAAWQDSLGGSQLYSRLTLSPGGLLGSNNNSTFDAVRPGASASYWRVNAAYNRQIELPAQWAVGVNVNAQLANQALISSERMGLSGVGGVRGYYSSTLVADAGVTAALELQTPRQAFNIADQTGNWYALAFVDAGRSWNATTEYNADLDRTGRKFSLSSYGLGARFETSKRSHLRLDVAKRNSGLASASNLLWHGSWQVAF